MIESEAFRARVLLFLQAGMTYNAAIYRALQEQGR